MRRGGLWRFFCLLIAGACADEPTAPPVVVRPDGPLTLVMSVDPEFVAPGGEAVVAIEATVPEDQRLSAVRLRFTGLGAPTVADLPIVGNGPHSYRIDIRIARVPFEGQLHIEVVAQVGTVSDTGAVVLTITDDGPPTIVLTAARAVEPPDSLEYRYEGHDVSELDSLFVHVFDAAGVLLDSVIIRQQTPFVFGSRRVWVPANTPLGDSILLEASAIDLFGKTTNVRRVVRMADTTQPTLTVEIDTVEHAALDSTYPPLIFFPGDTIRFRIKGADQYSLRSLGYRWLHLSDSVTPAQRVDSAQFAIVVPPGTNTPYAWIVAWARDSTGNEAAQNIYAVVMDGALRPVQVLNPVDGPLSVFDQPGGGVLDAVRDRYYFAASDNQVRAIALNPLQQLASIPFGSAVRSVDLSPTGDSLIALLNTQPPRLLSWDLDAGPAVMDTTAVTSSCCGAWDMQVAANGHALVTGFELVDVHLATGAQRVRSPMLSGAMNLVSSPDRRYIVQWDELRAAVYQSDLDSLSPLRQLFPGPPPSVPANRGPDVNSSGSILNQNRLYDVSLTTFQQVLPDPGQFPQAQALSQDGRWAYIGNWPGYWKVDVLSGTVIEQVVLPYTPARLIAHPDGQRLIVLSRSWFGVVDLR